MSTTTTTAPVEGIRFDDAATYSQAMIARAFGVSERSVERWRKGKRNRFPRPFYVGNVPHWKGQTINAWMDRKQQEAAA
jgi:predicted DNA-binding transcriptional regulator AlpA